MTVRDIATRLGVKCTAGEGGLERAVCGCYIGDQLSLALARAEKDNIWVTTTGHLNAVAVGVRVGVSCIILCHGAPLDTDAAQHADTRSLPILKSDIDAFNLAVELGRFFA